MARGLEWLRFLVCYGVMKPFLIRWLITTMAVLAVSLLPWVGVHADGLGALLGAGLLLGFFNAFLRPVLLLVSLPLILVTAGLFFFVVNAATLYLVGSAIPGFHVDGFWSALFGSMLIGFFSWLLGLFIQPGGGRGRVQVRTFNGGVFGGGFPGAGGYGGGTSHRGRHDLHEGGMGAGFGQSESDGGDRVEPPPRDGEGAFDREPGIKPVRGRVIE